MKTRSTLLLLLAAGGLFFGIQFYEKNHLSNREAAIREEFVLHFNRDEIDRILIDGIDGEIELKKVGQRWEVESPVKDRADQALVNQLLDLTFNLRKEAAYDRKEIDKKSLKNFGVAKSNLRLKLEGKGAPPEISFGKETAVDGKVYIRVENKIYVVAEDLKTLVSQKPDTFREHRIADVEGPHVYRAVIKTAAGEMELIKEGDHWNLVKPLKTRANSAAVVDLIGSILNTEIRSFVPEKGANFNTYGLGEPRATVLLWASSRELPIIIELGASAPEGEETFARLSNRGSVCLLPQRVEKILTLKPNDFRDRHVVRFELDIVDRITIAPHEGTKTILQRKQEDWAVLPEGKLANPREVENMIKRLQTQEITAFVTDVASDLEKYGLATPSLRVTFSSYSSETTAEGTAGEHPIVTIAFGAIDGENVYARLENEPFIVSLPKTILEAIPTAPTEWLQLAPLTFSPEEVTSVELSLNGKPRTFNRSTEGWSETAVESLINTFAKLSPMRRLSAPLLTDGEKPEGTLRFTLRDGKDVKVTIGKAAPDGSLSIAIEGEPGQFILSAPDASALKLP